LASWGGGACRGGRAPPPVSFVTHIHLSIMYKREDEGIFADGYANPAYALIDWK